MIKHIDRLDDATDGMDEMEATKDIFDCDDPGGEWLMVLVGMCLVGLVGAFFWSVMVIIDYWRAYA